MSIKVKYFSRNITKFLLKYDWEQRKLGEVGEFEKGRGYSKKELVKYGHKIILYGHLYTNYKTVIEIIDTCVENDKYSVKSKVGDIIIPSSGESSEDIARASVVPYSGIILGGDLNIITIDKKMSTPIFVALAVSNGNKKKELSKLSQGKSVVHLYNSDLKKINLLFPALEEQHRIETFFIHLDNLIALHKRKLNLLKQIKQGYLQQMFPKNGEKVPKLRFANFEGDWEERKLGEILTERSELMTKNEDFPLVSFTVENGVTPKTIRYEREQLVKGNKDGKQYKVTRLNDIVYNPANLKFGAINRNKYGNAVFSPIYITFDVNLEIAIPEYVEKLVTNNNFIKYSLKYQQGTVYERQSVTPENLLSIYVTFPTVNEQVILGKFLWTFDNFATFYQTKITKLNMLKHIYLQKMFI